ncbi:MAG: tRNA guanosine(34) transglycosylase Tgt [Minisyncoccia bacterium]
MQRPISFCIEKKLPGAQARAGVIRTPHGAIETPAFVGVGTKATIKGLSLDTLAAVGLPVLIANTYHLYLSGLEAVEKAGGVGAFMGWQGPTMTDSGGFQVFSLGTGFGKKISKFSVAAETSDGLRSDLDSLERRVDLEHPTLYDENLAASHGKLAIVDEDGVTFTSHLDGSLHRFTPERSIEIQHALAADIIFAFDECTAPDADRAYQQEAMERTHRWAARSLAAHRQNFEKNQSQFIYGIGQGGQFDDLRRQSARAIGEMGFDGFGLGGSFSHKYGDDSLQSALDMLRELPGDMSVHGLGVGEPEDIFEAAAAGVDTFDCVLPTRNGRTGTLYTARGKINISAAAFRFDFAPVDETCDCFVCVHHTRAYLHHLFRSREMLGPVLASAHNMRFLVRLTARIRESILNGNFETFRDAFLTTYLAK